ncbi:MAG: response regulator [Bdellovibrionales bacterium]|nr:response regulator [Bdellovibrionales bacterium]
MAQDTNTPQTAEKKSGTLVVIDDDSDFREKISGTLRSHGYTVESFESGLHAFRYMEGMPWSWAPRLVLTDIVMNGMGGFHVMKRVEELYPRRSIPCVVVSKLSSADYKYEAEASGASAYLAKPVDNQELLNTVDSLLTKKKKQAKK